MNTVVDVIYKEFTDLINFLQSGEISLQTSVNNTYKKSLALAAASYFEFEIRRILVELVSDRAANDELIKNFIKNKAIERQYHTYFHWDGNNANSFLGLFGDDFKESACADIRADIKLSNAITAFLELGNTRNQLAHLNFASFALDMTAEEVYKKYEKGYIFVNYLEKKLKRFGRDEQ